MGGGQKARGVKGGGGGGARMGDKGLDEDGLENTQDPRKVYGPHNDKKEEKIRGSRAKKGTTQRSIE